MKEDKLQEIKALVNLVDDPDELIYNQIKSKIISMGKEVIPMLESAWEFKQEFGDLFVKRIENIIHTIQFKEVYSLLENWINKGGKDLLEAAIIISKFQYPDLEEDKIHSQIELKIGRAHV